MRWWGWGAPGHAPALDARTLGFLRERLGTTGTPRPPVALASVRLPATRLTAETAADLRAVVGEEGLSEDHGERVLHAAGKGYPDLVRMRAGEPEGAPDAVLYPRSSEQLRALLRACAEASVAVVPFGGGTSVVGGLAPYAGEHAAVVALDLAQMGAVVALDGQSATVTVEAGIRAPALEAHLRSRGLTLGHFPQSFEYVSLGGCAATRSAGQASTGYGAIEELVLGLRMVAPAGNFDLAPIPASAAGPDLRQLLVGSEGTLGVISELSLRVRQAPSRCVYEGVFFADFDTGAAALRELARERVLPDIARLSDEQETATSLLLAGGGPKARLGGAYLTARGVRGGALAILGFEGTEHDVEFRRARVRALMRPFHAVRVGRSPGEAWLAGRFAAPYLRDELLTHGVMVETLETAGSWSRLRALYGDVRDAIARALAAGGTPGMVMCHISHVYESGASLYFTFLARQREGQELAQWQTVKDAASAAILAAGGTITHHHAVGRDHAPYLPQEVGKAGVEALRAVKAELDPTGIMNPGKLLVERP
jgi:alkyldihydroxyacetonephosphate synthase